MAPHAVEVSANVNTTVDAASSPEDVDLTPEQIDEQLEAIAEVLTVARDVRRSGHGAEWPLCPKWPLLQDCS